MHLRVRRQSLVLEHVALRQMIHLTLTLMLRYLVLAVVAAAGEAAITVRAFPAARFVMHPRVLRRNACLSAKIALHIDHVPGLQGNVVSSDDAFRNAALTAMIVLHRV